MAKACAKCGGDMTEGVVVDHGHGQTYPERWQPGQPSMSFWFGLRENKRAQLTVETWRCDRCGFLESYAPAADRTAR